MPEAFPNRIDLHHAKPHQDLANAYLNAQAVTFPLDVLLVIRIARWIGKAKLVIEKAKSAPELANKFKPRLISFACTKGAVAQIQQTLLEHHRDHFAI